MSSKSRKETLVGGGASNPLPSNSSSSPSSPDEAGSRSGGRGVDSSLPLVVVGVGQEEEEGLWWRKRR